MMLPLRGLASVVVTLALALGPSTGCGDDLPDVFADGDGQGATTTGTSGTTSTTNPPMTVTSVDGTAGSMSDSMGSTSGTTTSSSSSGAPGSSGGTTMGVSATEGSSDGTTSDGTTSNGSTTGAMTSSGGMTSGMTTGAMTTGSTGPDTTTDMGTTDPGTTSGGTTSGGSTDGGTTDGTVDVPDFTGDFLLAVATPVDPTLPFQYIANFDYVPSGFGGGTVDVELQPLALDTGSSTTPRTFFGPPLVFPAIPVTGTGTFAIPVGILNIAAETNPLFFIDAQANNVVFSAQVLDTDNVCGTVAGMLVVPVAQPLDGTTFAAVRVADVMPPGLPLVFPVACP